MTNKQELEQVKKVLEEEYRLHYNIPDKMTTKGFQEIKYAIKTALKYLDKIGEMEKRERLCGDECAKKELEIVTLKAQLARLRKGLPTKVELHEIWYKETGDEITLSIAKGLKAIEARIRGEK